MSRIDFRKSMFEELCNIKNNLSKFNISLSKANYTHLHYSELKAAKDHIPFPTSLILVELSKALAFNFKV